MLYIFYNFYVQYMSNMQIAFYEAFIIFIQLQKDTS